MMLRMLVICLLSASAKATPIMLQLGKDDKSAGNAIHQLARQPSASTHGTLGALVQDAAVTYEVDPYLIIAIIHAESNFIAHARSPKGAIGLMQVMPATARQYGHYDLYHPRDNIMVGTRHLSYLLRRYGSIPHALAAYNAGEGNVDKYRGIPPFGETQNYVKKVIRSYHSAKGHAINHPKPTSDGDNARGARPIIIHFD